MNGNVAMEDRSTVGQMGDGTRGTLRLLLRPEEGAEALGVSRARFYELMSKGQIKSIKIGRSRRIPISELQSWIDFELAEQSA